MKIEFFDNSIDYLNPLRKALPPLKILKVLFGLQLIKVFTGIFALKLILLL